MSLCVLPLGLLVLLFLFVFLLSVGVGPCAALCTHLGSHLQPSNNKSSRARHPPPRSLPFSPPPLPVSLYSGTVFQRVIDDSIVVPGEVKRLVFCTGKVYYDLAQERKNKGVKDVALVRVEQVRARVISCCLPCSHLCLCGALVSRGLLTRRPCVRHDLQIAPFPYELVAEALKKYAGAEIVWAQEEPRNMGAWQYVRPRLVTANKLAKIAPYDPRYGEPLRRTALLLGALCPISYLPLPAVLLAWRRWLMVVCVCLMVCVCVW